MAIPATATATTPTTAMTPNFVLSPTLKSRTVTPSGDGAWGVGASVSAHSLCGLTQIAHFGNRGLTSEALADVERRPPVHQMLSLEQRDTVRRTEGDNRVRLERRERRPGDLAVGRAEDRELARGREVEIERRKRVAEELRSPPERRDDETEDIDGPSLELVVAVDPRDPEQDLRQHRVARRRRVVVEGLLARDQPLAVLRGQEEAAAFVVREELDGESREPVGLLEPAQLSGCDVKLVEASRDVRVVVEKAGVLRPSLAVGA